MGFKKGHIPWNKGKKGLQPWHNISGLRPRKKGEFQHTEETKIKMREAKKDKTWEEIFGKEEAERKRKTLREVVHKKLIGRKRPDLTKRNLTNNPMWSKKAQKKSSLTHLIVMNIPEIKEKVLKATLKGMGKRPTSLEKKMIEIIKKQNLPYKYVGDGDFIIGGKCPDFVNINGQKICIEVRHTKVCEKLAKMSFDEYKKERIIHFAKYGWKCIVFDETQVNEEKVRTVIV